MDIELLKYMSATRDLIYATLALNALVTIAVVIYVWATLRKLWKAGRNGHESYDPLTIGYFNLHAANRLETDSKRTAAAVGDVIEALDVRHKSQMSEYRYQRKKMNSLLIIQRRIHDFMIFKRMPVADLPPIDESETDEEE